MLKPFLITSQEDRDIRCELALPLGKCPTRTTDTCSEDVHRSEKLVDIGFKNLAIAMASVVAIVLFSILIVVFQGSFESMARYGWQFLITSDWNPVDDQYGAGAAIYGTLITSLLALMIAVPLGVGTAIFITENIIPKPCSRDVIGLMVELLAAIPSVVLGLWAIFVIGTIHPSGA